MKILTEIKKLKAIAEARPKPPDPAAAWRATLKQVAKVYGAPGEMAEIDAMTDEEVRASYNDFPAALDRVYSMSDQQLEQFLAEDKAERARLASMSDEELEAIVTAGQHLN